MYLVQILLPNGGGASRNQVLAELHNTLIDKFGGLTAYSRGPAKGKWLSAGKVVRDDITVLEVMTKRVNRAWWLKTRKSLEHKLNQQEIVIRSQPMEQL